MGMKDRVQNKNSHSYQSEGKENSPQLKLFGCCVRGCVKDISNKSADTIR